MADMRWTDSQQDAISARRGTVLVAAAAGSGKTAVLVQRAIQRLTDPENPTSADRMLIVTFTKAAAAEMRARLEARLHQMLREDPGDPHLRRQSVLLAQAHIGTVDSFCAEMVREFFHLLDLSPDFKIISDKQEENLVDAALNEALSQAFEEGAVGALADAFAGERDDRRLLEMVLTLYRFMQSHPFPERWLQEKVEMYFPGMAAGTGPSPWERVILDYAGETAAHCLGLLSRALEECREDPAVEKAYAPALEKDRQALLRLEELARAGDWDGLSQAARDFAPARRGALRGYDGDPLKDRLESFRKEVKRAAGELLKYLAADRAACMREIAQTAPLVKSLQELTLDFSRRYTQKKREGNFLDYSDLEHQAIRLFLGEDGQPTPAAREVAARFDEIMIDEYQDINEVQDSLFRAVSQNGENLFMVGDVKQSIYGFRRAMPEIFLRARRAFPKYRREQDRYPASITLDRNFRSRKEVTDTVNFVFSRLMTQAAGDMDYTGEERLVCGADYAPKEGCQTELEFIARQGGASPEEAEGAWIARRIRQLVEGGFTVTDKDGERPATYGDFCVLLRSANQYAHAYAQELQARGVPARASVAGGFFQAAEIGVMLSLLRVIDNPNQDIPLLAVLMSPLYGFTADDVARLRLESRDVSVYVSLLRAAEGQPRCAQVVQELGQYRAVAATMPSDGFLNYLYTKTGYPDMALAMEDGPQRLANLRLLEKYARDYESSGYHGVSGFVRFLDKLRDSGSDLQAAELSPQDRDAVTVMSIHKSKGLEFPVCIVAGCGRNFVSDQRAEVLLHPELGLGVKLRDPARSARFTTTAREAIGLETARASAAEELRVLYVALTRAREKLLLVGSWEDPERTAEKLALELTEAGPAPYTVRRAKNAAQWLLLCALCHPDGGDLRLLAGLHPLGHSLQPVPARGGGPFPGSPCAPAPRLAAVPPPAAADCLCLPPPGGGGHPGQGGGLQAGGGAGRQPGHHPLPARLAGRAGHDPRRAGHGPPRLYAVRGLCRRPPRPGEGAGPPGGPGLAHPGAGGRGGPAPGAEVFGKPPGPAGAPLPPGGEGAPLHRGDTRRPGAAGDRQRGGGHPPGGGGLHLCGGRTAAHHRFQDRPGADHGGALAALPGPAAAVRLRYGGGLRPAGGAAGAVLHLAGAGQRPGL